MELLDAAIQCRSVRLKKSVVGRLFSFYPCLDGYAEPGRVCDYNRFPQPLDIRQKHIVRSV